MAFTGFRARQTLEDEETTGDAMIVMEANMDSEEQSAEAAPASATSNAPTTVVEFGPIARALLLTEGGADDGGAMFVRISSWLILATANWPDSKVCVKAATLLVKIIDFVSFHIPSFRDMA